MNSSQLAQKNIFELLHEKHQEIPHTSAWLFDDIFELFADNKNYTANNKTKPQQMSRPQYTTEHRPYSPYQTPYPQHQTSYPQYQTANRPPNIIKKERGPQLHKNNIQTYYTQRQGNNNNKDTYRVYIVLKISFKDAFGFFHQKLVISSNEYTNNKKPYEFPYCEVGKCEDFSELVGNFESALGDNFIVNYAGLKRSNANDLRVLIINVYCKSHTQSELPHKHFKTIFQLYESRLSYLVWIESSNMKSMFNGESLYILNKILQKGETIQNTPWKMLNLKPLHLSGANNTWIFKENNTQTPYFFDIPSELKYTFT